MRICRWLPGFSASVGRRCRSWHLKKRVRHGTKELEAYLIYETPCLPSVRSWSGILSIEISFWLCSGLSSTNTYHRRNILYCGACQRGNQGKHHWLEIAALDLEHHTFAFWACIQFNMQLPREGIHVDNMEHLLTPNDLTSGTGYFGPSTRLKMNSIYGCTSGNTVSTGSANNTGTALCAIFFYGS